MNVYPAGYDGQDILRIVFGPFGRTYWGNDSEMKRLHLFSKKKISAWSIKREEQFSQIYNVVAGGCSVAGNGQSREFYFLITHEAQPARDTIAEMVKY